LSNLSKFLEEGHSLLDDTSTSRVEILAEGQLATSSNLWASKYPSSKILLFKLNISLASKQTAPYRYGNILYFPYEVSDVDQFPKADQMPASTDLQEVNQDGKADYRLATISLSTVFDSIYGQSNPLIEVLKIGRNTNEMVILRSAEKYLCKILYIVIEGFLKDSDKSKNKNFFILDAIVRIKKFRLKMITENGSVIYYNTELIQSNHSVELDLS